MTLWTIPFLSNPTHSRRVAHATHSRPRFYEWRTRTFTRLSRGCARSVLRGQSFDSITNVFRQGRYSTPPSRLLFLLINLLYSLFLSATNDIIEEATYSGIIDPSPEWHTLNHRGPRATLTYRVRVKCDSHYYNATCTKFCRPRDDKFGHYICDANGDKECIEGWKGATCDFGTYMTY